MPLHSLKIQHDSFGGSVTASLVLLCLVVGCASPGAWRVGESTGVAGRENGVRVAAIGRLFEAQGRYAEARGMYQRALDDLPDNRALQERLAQLDSRDGNDHESSRSTGSARTVTEAFAAAESLVPSPERAASGADLLPSNAEVPKTLLASHSEPVGDRRVPNKELSTAELVEARWQEYADRCESQAAGGGDAAHNQRPAGTGTAASGGSDEVQIRLEGRIRAIGARETVGAVEGGISI